MLKIKLLLGITLLILLSSCNKVHKCEIGEENEEDCGVPMKVAFDEAIKGSLEIDKKKKKSQRSKNKENKPLVENKKYPPINLNKGAFVKKGSVLRRPEQVYSLKIYPIIQEEGGVEYYYGPQIIYYSIDGQWVGNRKNSLNSNDFPKFNFGDSQPVPPENIVNEKTTQKKEQQEIIPSIKTISEDEK